MRTSYQKYDHRLKAVIAVSGDCEIADELGVPRSTAATWIRRGVDEVVTHESFDLDVLQLQARILELERDKKALASKVTVLETVIEVQEARLDSKRLPEGSKKLRLLEVIESAIKLEPVENVLGWIGMTSARFYRWRRLRKECRLVDYPSCPKRMPLQLTNKELMKMRTFVIDPSYAHIPVTNLAMLAAKMGAVVASPSTWYKRIRSYGWIRPRKRLYQRRHRAGIRASRVNEIWHIDVTQIQLVNNVRVYIHACLDNFSRHVLAYRFAFAPTAIGCRELLQEALATSAATGIPTVLCDSGIENVNREVDKLVDEQKIVRQIAQVEVDFSNSMIEAFFRSMKNNHLYNHRLSDYETVKKLVTFYIDQHNNVVPHSAFRGATPFEVFSGTWSKTDELALRQKFKSAVKMRIAENQAKQSCGNCDSYPEAPEAEVA